MARISKYYQINPFIGLFFCIFLGKIQLSFGQIDAQNTGAVAQGMGNITAIQKDATALLNNVANVSNFNHYKAFLAYDLRHNQQSFQTISMGFIAPLDFSKKNQNNNNENLETKEIQPQNPKKLPKYGVIGLALGRFGDNLYNEQKISLAYAHQIEGASVGIKVHYAQQYIKDFGSRGNFVVEIGGNVTLSKEFQAFFSAYNLTGSILKSDFGENLRIPSLVRVALQYQPTQNLRIATELEKDLRYDPFLKIGAEYQPTKNFFLRTGIQTTQQIVLNGGAGFQARKWRFDYSLASQSILGLSHSLALQCSF
jgi:hypothetical protein